MPKVKKDYYETGVAMMDFFRSVLWTKQKCRIVIDYDPAKEMVEIEKTIIESDEPGSLPESQKDKICSRWRQESGQGYDAAARHSKS